MIPIRQLRLAAIFTFIAAYFLGCGGSEDPRVVAKVGHYTLTKDMLEGAANPESGVNDWVVKRLLALEAENRKLNESPEFLKFYNEFRVGLLAKILLDREAAALDSPSVSDMDEYYETHKEEFQLSELEVETAYFSAREAADLSSAVTSLRRGALETTVASRNPGLDFGRDTIVDPASRKKPFSDFAQLKPGDIMGPVFIDDRYYVFRITERHEPGDYRTRAESEEVIQFRIMENRRYKQREKLLNELRSKYNPSINEERLKALGITVGDNE